MPCTNRRLKIMACLCDKGKEKNVTQPWFATWGAPNATDNFTVGLPTVHINSFSKQCDHGTEQLYIDWEGFRQSELTPTFCHDAILVKVNQLLCTCQGWPFLFNQRLKHITVQEYFSLLHCFNKTLLQSMRHGDFCSAAGRQKLSYHLLLK